LRIYIEDFQFKTIIGILDFERDFPQDVLIDLIIDYDFSDGKFINYVDIRDLIKETMINWKFGLLEDALEHLFHLILQEHQIKYMRLKIGKPSILKDAIVSVEMEKTIE